MYPSLNLPTIEIAISYQNDKPYIFDVFRRKKILLTPEEWVRQHFMHFMVNGLDYPKPLIKTEGGLKYNQKQKRTDIVVFNRNGAPFLLVECKAPHIKLDSNVLFQATVYNQIINAPYIVITNGRQHLICHLVEGELIQLDHFPPFPAMLDL